MILSLSSVMAQCSSSRPHPSWALKKSLKSCLFVFLFPGEIEKIFALSQGPGITNEKTSHSLPFQKFKHQVSSLDAQPSHGNTIVVLLTGTLLVSEDQEYSHRMGHRIFLSNHRLYQVDGEQSPMNYTQCFELMPENDGYYIQNDISRLIYSY